MRTTNGMLQLAYQNLRLATSGRSKPELERFRLETFLPIPTRFIERLLQPKSTRAVRFDPAQLHSFEEDVPLMTHALLPLSTYRPGTDLIRPSPASPRLNCPVTQGHLSVRTTC